ncbi:MAG: class I SAM-dependent methyltransferase [Steroidobacteraceae bacterium]
MTARIHWRENAIERSARWWSSRAAPSPERVRVVDDALAADEGYGQACQGVGLLWRGDFHGARQLLAALGKRAERAVRPARTAVADAAAFHRYRQARAQRARTLGMLLVELDGDYRIALRRAPDVRAACRAALGPPDGTPTVLSLRELQGFVGAHEWRLKGIDVPDAGGRIHPHYGVFAPVRSEYVGLVAQAPLPVALQAADLAFDLGTGTGVLAAVLARRGVGRIVATDSDARAIECARDNLERLGCADRVQLQVADLFPDGRAALIVCNPPWIPARATTSLERAVFDPDGRMLAGFLHGLGAHLVPGGEGWLVLSDLAEHLGLRPRRQLLEAIAAAGLQVVERRDARPAHPRALDVADPLHRARAAEVTSLWRLAEIPPNKRGT